MDTTYHYPPELLQLLVDTIPRLCRSKEDVLVFFRGAGVQEALINPLRARVRARDQSLNKFTIARTLLMHLNERGDAALRERREVLKRIVEFEDFSTCWPDDQLKAKGLVAEIRRVTDVKDAFTRIRQERDREAEARKAALVAEERRTQARMAELNAARSAFFSTFGIQDPPERGRKLEAALNQLFKAQGILVKEAFTLRSDETGRILEQIDAVIEIGTHLYLVEVKWRASRLDVDEISRHLVRIYHRGHTRGLFITASELTEAALGTCTEALQQTVVAVVLLDEIVSTLENGTELVALLQAKINAAQTDKLPFYRP